MGAIEVPLCFFVFFFFVFFWVDLCVYLHRAWRWQAVIFFYFGRMYHEGFGDR